MTLTYATFYGISLYFRPISPPSDSPTSTVTTLLAFNNAIVSHVPPDPPLLPPLWVYYCQHLPPLDRPSINSSLGTEFDLLIAFHKGIHSTHNPSSHYIAPSNHQLSPSLYKFLSSKIVDDVLAQPDWRQAMMVELCAIQNSGT